MFIGVSSIGAYILEQDFSYSVYTFICFVRSIFYGLYLDKKQSKSNHESKQINDTALQVGSLQVGGQCLLFAGRDE